MMGQATPMTNNSNQLSEHLQSLSLVKESNDCKENVDGQKIPFDKLLEKALAVEQGGPLLPDTTQQNLEPGNQTEKSPQRTVRTRSRGKRERGALELPVVSALAADADTFLGNKRRARKPKGEEPSQSTDALAAGEPAIHIDELHVVARKESTGSAEREKRKRRPSSRLLNGKGAVSPAGPQLPGDGKSTVKVESLITPIISEAGPEAETQSTKKGRLSKLPIKNIKKMQSPKAKSRTNDTVASATEGTPLPSGGSGCRSTKVKKRGRPKNSPIGSTASLEGKQITQFFAGPSEARETPVQVPEGPSSKVGDDVGITKTYRKRKGKPQKYLNIGSVDDLPAAGTSIPESDDQPLSMLFGFPRQTAKNPRLSSLGDEEGGGSQKKTDKGTPKNKSGGDSLKKTDKQTPTSKAGDSEKKTDKETPTSMAVIEWKAIGEMEVFDKFPLADVEESGRKGLTVCHFANNIVDKALELKLADSAENINACLGNLDRLEYEITAIRGRVKKLLSIKEGQEKLRENLTVEKIKIEEEIFEFKEKIEHLHEELAAAESRREKKDSEIGNLKAKLASMYELIVSNMVGADSEKKKIEWSRSSSVFINSSPIWKAIGEMEVFHKFPQNPHFRPLADLKESCREGFAIGNLVNFANIVDKAFKLKSTDSADTINACLGTLLGLDLEVQGFDITAIRDHLMKLLSIKEVENQTEELTADKIKIDEEIFEFNKQIDHLEEELAAAKSRKEKKDLEISDLNAKMASMSELLIVAGAALNVEDGVAFNDLILSVIGEC